MSINRPQQYRLSVRAAPKDAGKIQYRSFDRQVIGYPAESLKKTSRHIRRFL
ncbi:MAG: hypothetical protein KBF68_03635 [Nitrosomonas sp.]|jgi:hypothetical protein|nr:hypothetical protein [Nitrosomonas sp.]